jgi:acetyl/propionyl-CoA carboxylase alpha subunit
MIHTVLIANRGEIALRVIRTCRALGVRSIAIFTELDRQAPHVREADDAVHVPGYLDIDAVVAAARGAGAEAIHPGYGFLSERAEFARAVEAAGLVLVGPSADVMDRMGRKDAAREIAIAAGVPVVPQGGDDPAHLAYPVLVKAASGGGGKGMRIVRRAEDYDAAVAAAKREAKAAFGDDTILVEKYVEHGRHVEVQVLADAHGNVVHLYERDCSTQRRHQKVLEEAPAPTIGDDVRKVVTDAAVALAAHVGYQNAGTVEFLLDTQPAPGESGVYFLEMNTRLQVEHPVTELAVQVGGRPLDLVELQLRVAAGEELPTTSPCPDTRSRPGSMPRTRSTGSCPRPGGRCWSAGPNARASTPPSRAARRSARPTTPCWARSSSTHPTARPPAARSSPPWTTRRSWA